MQAESELFRLSLFFVFQRESEMHMKPSNTLGNIRKDHGKLLLIAALAFLAILPLNILTPLQSDDFSYCFSFADKERIDSLGDIFSSMYAHYHTMNGRVILHFLVQLTLWLPHILFKFVNTAMFVLMGLLMYAHGVYGEQKPRQHPVLLTLIYVALWWWLPLFGASVLGHDASVNYLWGTVLILLFLLPYRMYYSNENVFHKKRWIPLMLLLGFLAGGCNENTSGAAFGMVVLFLLRYMLQHKKLRAWTLTGLLGVILGLLFMILAPATSLRMDTLMEGTDASFLIVSSLSDLYRKFVWLYYQMEAMVGTTTVYLVIFLGAYLIFRNRSFRKLEAPVIYFLGMLAAVYAMLIPPIVPERAFFGAVVFLIITLSGMLVQLEVRRDIPVTLALLTCLMAVTGTSYLEALKQNALVYHKYQQRTQYVQEQKAQGNRNLTFQYIEPHGRYCAWIDMSEDPDYYYNRSFARYFGLDSVVVPRE